MPNDIYLKELERVMTDTSPPPTTTRTRPEIEAEVAEISARLRGPLSNVERLWLVEDREVLRKQLAVHPEPREPSDGQP